MTELDRLVECRVTDNGGMELFDDVVPAGITAINLWDDWRLEISNPDPDKIIIGAILVRICTGSGEDRAGLSFLVKAGERTQYPFEIFDTGVRYDVAVSNLIIHRE